MPKDLDLKGLTGWGLLLGALYLSFGSVLHSWKDLQEWHGALSMLTPAFFSNLYDQLSPTLLAAGGGLLLRRPFESWDEVTERRAPREGVKLAPPPPPSTAA